MMNGKTTEDFMSVIGSALVPLSIGAVTVGLKKLIMKALESPTEGTEQSINLFPNAMNVADQPRNEEPLVIGTQGNKTTEQICSHI